MIARIVLAALLAAVIVLRAAAAAEVVPAGGRAADRRGGGRAWCATSWPSRGIAGELPSRSASPRHRCPIGPATPMRVALVDLRYDRRTGRFQGRLAGDAALGRDHADRRPRAGSTSWSRSRCRPGRSPAARRSPTPTSRAAWLPAASLPDDGLRRAEDLVGRQAVRRSPPGRAARAGEVAAPWQVRRGEDASMAFSRGGLQIVTAAEALENGRQGQTIRVRNAASGEVRQAVVVGPRRVEVLGVAP